MPTSAELLAYNLNQKFYSWFMRKYYFSWNNHTRQWTLESRRFSRMWLYYIVNMLHLITLMSSCTIAIIRIANNDLDILQDPHRLLVTLFLTCMAILCGILDSLMIGSGLEFVAACNWLFQEEGLIHLPWKIGFAQWKCIVKCKKIVFQIFNQLVLVF